MQEFTDLQFELDNLDIGLSTSVQVVVLNDKLVLATEKGVTTQYIELASQLREKMAKAIQAKKILNMFNEYPANEISDPIKWDPKTKKPIDPLKLALQNQRNKICQAMMQNILMKRVKACVKFGLIVCRRKGTINKKNEKCNERQKGN